MTGRFARSWELAKASLEVVKADKELLWIPVLSTLAAMLVAVSFVAPAVVNDWLRVAAEGQEPLLFVWAAAFYVTSYFVMFYFNTVLVGAALIRLEGGDPTLGDGFRIANERFWTILGYALIAATVGMILRAIEERVGWVGRLVVGLVGAAWTVATFLAVPVLVAQRVGPVEAVTESVSLLKRTWGENLIGSVGLGFAFFVAWLVLAVGAVLLMMLVGQVFGAAAAGVILAAALLGAVALGILYATLQGVYAAALYRFATSGEPGFGFGADQVRQAFVPRGGPTVR